MSTLGDRIKQLRERANLSQTRLAELCGVTKAAVSQWESGVAKTLSGASLIRVAEVLGVEPGNLLNGPLPVSNLTKEQQDVLDLFGQLSISNKEIAIRLLRALK